MTAAAQPQADSAVGPTLAQRWRSWRWVALALVVILAVSILIAYLTAPRPGGLVGSGVHIDRRRTGARDPAT